MLPVRSRLRRGGDFSLAVRRGRRVGRPTLVLSLLSSGEPAGSPPRVGFVVGRRVGGAVVRNRLRRRLRHIVAARLDRLPPDSLAVIRALPGAERLSSATLAAEVDLVVSRVAR